MNEYLNPWYILAETGTGRHIIMMQYGNGDKPNVLNSWWIIMMIIMIELLMK